MGIGVGFKGTIGTIGRYTSRKLEARRLGSV